MGKNCLWNFMHNAGVIYVTCLIWCQTMVLAVGSCSVLCGWRTKQTLLFYSLRGHCLSLSGAWQSKEFCKLLYTTGTWVCLNSASHPEMHCILYLLLWVLRSHDSCLLKRIGAVLLCTLSLQYSITLACTSASSMHAITTWSYSSRYLLWKTCEPA